MEVGVGVKTSLLFDFIASLKNNFSSEEWKTKLDYPHGINQGGLRCK